MSEREETLYCHMNASPKCILLFLQTQSPRLHVVIPRVGVSKHKCVPLQEG